MSEDDATFQYPENIEDIADEGQLTKLLRHMFYYSFIIENGFIYCVDDLDEYRLGYYIWFMRLDEIRTIYEIYKRCLKTGENKDSYYSVTHTGTTLSGTNYLMLGGYFTLIAQCDCVHEHGDLLFTKTKYRAIAFVNNTTYYNVPLRLVDAKEHFSIANPVTAVYKFKKIYHYHITNDKMYIIISGEVRYIADPFDSELAIPCADTYELINVVTGQRTPTWPLKQIARYEDTMAFLMKYTDFVSLAVLYYDEKWDTYHLGNDSRSHGCATTINILKLTKAGKNTKVVADTD